MVLKHSVSFSVAVPEQPYIKEISLSRNNEINVKCRCPGEFNGPGSTVRAYLYESGTLISTESKSIKSTSNCDFRFADLRYLTSYRVEVCAAANANKTLRSFMTP